MRTHAGLVSVLLLTCATPVLAFQSLRFHGHGVNDIDRVKIRIDDPANNLPGPPADVGAADFTLEFWLRGWLAENAAPPVSCGPGIDWIYGNVVLDRDRYNQDRKFGLSLAGGRFVWGVSGDGTGDLTICGTTMVLDGAWHHVAVQRRRSDGWMQLWIDGTLEGSGDGPNGDVSYPDDGTPGPFCGGPCVGSDPFLVLAAEKHDAGALYPSFSGWIDELRISNVLRYGSNFAPPLAPFATDLATAALYHFDEGAGNLIQDVSGASGGPSHGERRFGGTPPGPEWSAETPFGPGQALCANATLGADHTTNCPCGNVGAASSGCAHSFSSLGALLTASGAVLADDVVLSAQQLPSSAFTLFLQHDAAGDQVFHDGVLCAGGTLVRLRGRGASGGAASFPNTAFDEDATLTLSQRGGVSVGSGLLRYYSAWYRNASTSFCPPATANVTNGWRVRW